MDIPFESFCSLIHRLSHPPTPKLHTKPLSPSQIFSSWLDHLPRPFAPGTGKHLFRLLYPHEGSRRRYGLKETRLAVELEQILCVQGLCRWDAAGWGEGGSGCLGTEVERSMRDSVFSAENCAVSIAKIDTLLDQLAAHSAFSQLSQPPDTFPSAPNILSTLYRDSGLSSYALAVLTQIILQDLRPLLSPLPALRVSNPTAMLRLKSNAGPAQLELYTAMKCWDKRMADMYRRGVGDVDVCADEVERMGLGASASHGPVVGVNVQIPKCLKGRGVDEALKEFTTSQPCQSVWAETKYDGYRMQIHVQVHSEDDVRMTIFSKSKRNATADRLNTHAIILAALGYPIPTHIPAHPLLAPRTPRAIKRIRRSVILEAEVVPYNEANRQGGRGPGIEEFWWLSSVGVSIAPASHAPIDPKRHLCLCFFDILHLDGKSLLDVSLRHRRELLQQHVVTIPGFSQLSEYRIIPLAQGTNVARRSLQSAFAATTLNREEGLVLKAPDSCYMDRRWRWVKLKKDYIPSLGDCVDLVLLGAGWDPDRARDLRVDTSVFTSFYVGSLTNRSEVKARRETPHFEVLFKVSYGLSRDQLEEVNTQIRHRHWPTKRYDKDDRFKRRLLGLSWTYTMRRDLSAPSVLLERPMCCEIMGAGFQKIMGSKFYEVRWPRLQKIWDTNERSWTDAVSSSQLLDEAHKSLGYAPATSSPTSSPKDDSIRALWRSSSAANLTDIPELPTPSPERPSPRRMQSAPNLRDRIELSPSSPSKRQAIAHDRVVQRSPIKVKEEEEKIDGQTGLSAVDDDCIDSSRSGRRHGDGAKSAAINVVPAQVLTEKMVENMSDDPRAVKRKKGEEHAEGDARQVKRRKQRNKPLSLRSRIRMVCRGEKGPRRSPVLA